MSIKYVLIHALIFSHQFFGEAIYTTNILYVKEDFYIKLFDTYSKLKINFNASQSK